MVRVHVKRRRNSESATPCRVGLRPFDWVKARSHEAPSCFRCSLPAVRPAAQSKHAGLPPISGDADFAEVWERVDAGQLVARDPPDDLPNHYIQLCSDTIFASADDIDAFFRRRFAVPFNEAFARSVAGKGEWGGTGILPHQDREKYFNLFWNAYLKQREVTLLKFLMYSSVFIKECGGILKSTSEKINRIDALQYPGISYLFSSFEVQSGTKRYRKSFTMVAEPNGLSKF